MFRAKIFPYLLRFKEVAKTSRNSMLTKQTYFIILKEVSEGDCVRIGIGEIPLFKGLSAEDSSRFPQELKLIEIEINEQLQNGASPSHLSLIAKEKCWPSCVRFGIESALADLNSTAPGVLYPSTFTQGEEDIIINGLIWMGDKDRMFQRIEEKLALGFRCLKLKIGGIDFEQELELLAYIRSRFSEAQLTIRLDANCAFSPDNALERLSRLSRIGIHSIEQPLHPSIPWDIQRDICAASPIPIALDESLIGITADHDKKRLLESVSPDYIILKPSLCGGFDEATRWIDLAKELGIGWWVTSALESNVGLNAIAQWTGQYCVTVPQGLGTGALYSNNFPAPLSLHGDRLRFISDEAKIINQQQIASVCEQASNIDNYFHDSRLTAEAVEWWKSWNDDSPTIKAHTSGSTGTPKEIDLFKSDIVRSAIATNRFFSIDENSTLLCPLSTDYIAGKMIVARAEVAGARLIVCKSDELETFLNSDLTVDLLAIVPAQLDLIFSKPDFSRKIRNILIGGSPLSEQQEAILIAGGFNAYVSYGMTETCSHIAVRKVGEANYTAFPGIKLSVDSDRCLVIENPDAQYGRIVTNDIVDLSSTGHSFRWLGRRDNVINSGGKKFFPEELEKVLSAHLPFEFYIIGRPDAKWGEAITLVAQCSESNFPQSYIMELCRKSGLHRHALPKRIEYVNELHHTSSGKVKRI